MRTFRLDTKATPEKIRDKRWRYRLAWIDSRVATPIRQVLVAGLWFFSLGPRGSFLVPTILAAARRLVRQTRLIAAAHDCSGTPGR